MWLRRVPRRSVSIGGILRTQTTSQAPTQGHAVVSLTFDDGLASHARAADLLESRGLRGTFYVPSGLLGKPGRLDWGDLVRLAERGHEIGGHTESHAALTEIPLEQARQEIARDRDALTSRGLDPSSFAYPYGKFTDEIADLVRALGYAAARGVGGVVETVPPLNPYQLRTPHSARTWTTADHLAGLTLAAQHEEGWLILPFHHIGHDRGSTYTTQPGQFTAYLDWLVERDMPVIPVREVIARAN